MSRIFLLEDDPNLGQMITRGLELDGYEVIWAKDCKTSFSLSQQQKIDLFVLDWNLPDGLGLDLCLKIRKLDLKVPIIFLTARTEEETAIQGLTAGAQDFLRKPCGQKELATRIKRLLGEALNHEETIRFGDLVLRVGSRKIKFRDIDVLVHPKEFDVLVHLVRNGGIVSTRDSILNVIDPENTINDRAVDAHMSRLRNKFRAFGITDIEIQSIYGEGYRLGKAS